MGGASIASHGVPRGFMASHGVVLPVVGDVAAIAARPCGSRALPCGPTLWLKRQPSGPATPEPQGRGWSLILQRSISRPYKDKDDPRISSLRSGKKKYHLVPRQVHYTEGNKRG